MTRRGPPLVNEPPTAHKSSPLAPQMPKKVVPAGAPTASGVSVVPSKRNTSPASPARYISSSATAWIHQTACAPGVGIVVSVVPSHLSNNASPPPVTPPARYATPSDVTAADSNEPGCSLVIARNSSGP